RGLAGTFTTLIFSRPGSTKAPAPFLLSEAWATASRPANTARTSLAATPVVSAIWATRPDLLSTSLIGLTATGFLAAAFLAAFGAAFFFAAFLVAIFCGSRQWVLSVGWGAWVRPRHGECDRKSTPLNSSHVRTSYAVFCL